METITVGMKSARARDGVVSPVGGMQIRRRCSRYDGGVFVVSCDIASTRTTIIVP